MHSGENVTQCERPCKSCVRCNLVSARVWTLAIRSPNGGRGPNGAVESVSKTFWQRDPKFWIPDHVDDGGKRFSWEGFAEIISIAGFLSIIYSIKDE